MRLEEGWGKVIGDWQVNGSILLRLWRFWSALMASGWLWLSLFRRQRLLTFPGGRSSLINAWSPELWTFSFQVLLTCWFVWVLLLWWVCAVAAVRDPGQQNSRPECRHGLRHDHHEWVIWWWKWTKPLEIPLHLKGIIFKMSQSFVKSNWNRQTI